MRFDDALKVLRQGVLVTRTEWEDPKKFIEIDDGTFTITIEEYNYRPIPYTFSHTDLLAGDWEVKRQ